MKIFKKLLVILMISVIAFSYEPQLLATTMINETEKKTENRIESEEEISENISKEVEEENQQADIVTKTLYAIKSVQNMSLSGTNRGNYHDRQHLGIYMKAGASFEIRQTNLNLNQDLTLDCLNNDSATEKSYTVPKNGDWVSITIDTDSVPFIRTPFNTEEKPTVEIRNLQDTEELTYYYYQDNEEEFFQKWEENQHSYAVIENDRATFLVPLKDKEKIVKPNGSNYDFKSIDEMLEYYHEFVEQYDRYIGLSYETDNPLNQNVKTKFFVKANIHGAGAAYYGGNHTAQNGDSISGYLARGWLNLHEFGHGYAGSLANQDLDLGEVMNNILGHYYQITYLNENDGGWLGKKINIEKAIKTAREKVSHYNELSYQHKLYMFVDLLDKIGPEKSMSYVHSKYREYLNEGIRYNASDMYAKSFTEVSNYNVIPYLNSFKITPSEDIVAEVYEKELPMLYYLRDFTESDESANTIRKELNLQGNYDLVSNQDISKYNMKGNVSLTISIDDFEQIKGKKIYIKDGSKVVKEITINYNQLEITGLPVGIYTLQLPNTKTKAYRYSYEYLVVQENTTLEKEVHYNKIKVAPLAEDTKIILKGLGDVVFANATMDLENKKITVVSNNTSPHVYFNDEYANIQICDQNEKVVYEKSYIGNESAGGTDVINIEYGYTIKLKHREASTRLEFRSQILNQKEEFGNLNNQQTSYLITKYGLQKEGTSEEEQYEIYKRKVEKYIEKEKNDIILAKQENKYNYFIHKNKLLASILGLKEEDQEKYLSANKVLINGSAPIIEEIESLEMFVGNELNIQLDYFKVNDLEDGKITLNSNNATLLLDNIPTKGNKITTRGIYTAKLIVQDLDGNETEKEFTVAVKEKPEEQKTNSDSKEEENRNDYINPSEENTNRNQDKGKNLKTTHQKSTIKEDILPSGKLPQTGKQIILAISIVILLGISIWQYMKMRKIK